MMITFEDCARVSKLLCDTVGMLCRNSVTFKNDLQLQGLLGITVDGVGVILVQFNEKFTGDTSPQSEQTATGPTGPSLIFTGVQQAHETSKPQRRSSEGPAMGGFGPPFLRQPRMLALPAPGSQSMRGKSPVRGAMAGPWGGTPRMPGQSPRQPSVGTPGRALALTWNTGTPSSSGQSSQVMRGVSGRGRVRGVRRMMPSGRGGGMGVPARPMMSMMSRGAVVKRARGMLVRGAMMAARGRGSAALAQNRAMVARAQGVPGMTRGRVALSARGMMRGGRGGRGTMLALPGPRMAVQRSPGTPRAVRPGGVAMQSPNSGALALMPSPARQQQQRPMMRTPTNSGTLALMPSPARQQRPTGSVMRTPTNSGALALMLSPARQQTPGGAVMRSPNFSALALMPSPVRQRPAGPGAAAIRTPNSNALALMSPPRQAQPRPQQIKSEFSMALVQSPARGRPALQQSPARQHASSSNQMLSPGQGNFGVIRSPGNTPRQAARPALALPGIPGILPVHSARPSKAHPTQVGRYETVQSGPATSSHPGVPQAHNTGITSVMESARLKAIMPSTPTHSQPSFQGTKFGDPASVQSRSSGYESLASPQSNVDRFGLENYGQAHGAGSSIQSQQQAAKQIVLMKSPPAAQHLSTATSVALHRGNTISGYSPYHSGGLTGNVQRVISRATSHNVSTLGQMSTPAAASQPSSSLTLLSSSGSQFGRSGEAFAFGNLFSTTSATGTTNSSTGVKAGQATTAQQSRDSVAALLRQQEQKQAQIKQVAQIIQSQANMMPSSSQQSLQRQAIWNPAEAVASPTLQRLESCRMASPGGPALQQQLMCTPVQQRQQYRSTQYTPQQLQITPQQLSLQSTSQQLSLQNTPQQHRQAQMPPLSEAVMPQLQSQLQKNTPKHHYLATMPQPQAEGQQSTPRQQAVTTMQQLLTPTQLLQQRTLEQVKKSLLADQEMLHRASASKQHATTMQHGSQYAVSQNATPVQQRVSQSEATQQQPLSLQVKLKTTESSNQQQSFNSFNRIVEEQLLRLQQPFSQETTSSNLASTTMPLLSSAAKLLSQNAGLYEWGKQLLSPQHPGRAQQREQEQQQRQQILQQQQGQQQSKQLHQQQPQQQQPKSDLQQKQQQQPSQQQQQHQYSSQMHQQRQHESLTPQQQQQIQRQRDMLLLPPQDKQQKQHQQQLQQPSQQQSSREPAEQQINCEQRQMEQREENRQMKQPVKPESQQRQTTRQQDDIQTDDQSWLHELLGFNREQPLSTGQPLPSGQRGEQNATWQPKQQQQSLHYKLQDRQQQGQHSLHHKQQQQGQHLLHHRQHDLKQEQLSEKVNQQHSSNQLLDLGQQPIRESTGNNKNLSVQSQRPIDQPVTTDFTSTLADILNESNQVMYEPVSTEPASSEPLNPDFLPNNDQPATDGKKKRGRKPGKKLTKETKKSAAEMGMLSIDVGGGGDVSSSGGSKGEQSSYCDISSQYLRKDNNQKPDNRFDIETLLSPGKAADGATGDKGDDGLDKHLSEFLNYMQPPTTVPGSGEGAGDKVTPRGGNTRARRSLLEQLDQSAEKSASSGSRRGRKKKDVSLLGSDGLSESLEQDVMWSTGESMLSKSDILLPDSAPDSPDTVVYDDFFVSGQKDHSISIASEIEVETGRAGSSTTLGATFNVSPPDLSPHLSPRASPVPSTSTEADRTKKMSPTSDASSPGGATWACRLNGCFVQCHSASELAHHYTILHTWVIPGRIHPLYSEFEYKMDEAHAIKATLAARLVETPVAEPTASPAEKVPCPSCSRKFDTISGCLKHHSHAHGKPVSKSQHRKLLEKYGSGLWQCNLCSKGFVTKHELGVHRVKVHKVR